MEEGESILDESLVNYVALVEKIRQLADYQVSYVAEATQVLLIYTQESADTVHAGPGRCMLAADRRGCG